MLKGTKRRIKNGHYKQLDSARLMDELDEFAEFKKSILPALREDIKNGVSAEEIYKKAQALAATRMVMIAMREVDSTKAIAAVKDILDRTQGRATEKQEITHKLESLPDEQLDALLKSKLQTNDTASIDDDFLQ